MSCEDIQPRLSAFVDGEMSADDAAVVRAHVEGCDACRAVVQDLTRLRDSARALGPVAPPDHLWLEIAGQIRLEDDASAASGARVSAAAGRPVWQWVGLAAALVVITFGAYLFNDVSRSTDSTATTTAAEAGNASAPASVEAVAEELSAALEKAIADLRLLAESENRPEESMLAANLLENLTVVDQAIADSRAALEADPTSVPARDSLLEALRRKVTVLQATMSLMNEMRLGDPEAAARIAATAGKSS